MNSRSLVCLFALSLFWGCSSPRPLGLQCEDTVAVKRTAAARQSGIRDDVRQILESEVRSPAFNKRRLETGLQVVRLNVLALSAGGPWGAFGAGFLNAWREQGAADPARDDMQIVTGVSTGAVMSTYAFLGREYDSRLADEYQNTENKDIFKKRWIVAALFSNSLNDTAPLRKKLKERLNADVLNAVSEEHRKTRRLYVGAVDLDSGEFSTFELTSMADSARTNREACYQTAVLASAAIPIVFPPVFMDKAMYVDGGARYHLVLLKDLKVAIEEFEHAHPGLTVEKRLFVVVNGDLEFRPAHTDNGLLPIASQTASIATDQLVSDSVRRQFYDGPALGFKVFYVSAKGHQCAPPVAQGDYFDKTFMRCLYAYGHALGLTPNPWNDSDAEIPRASTH